MVSNMEPTVLFQGRFLRLSERNGWEYAEVHRATGVVGILAETAAGEVILIEQLRPAINQRVIELPGGLAGDEGTEETRETAARRELEEETGYGGGTWTSLGIGATSPGLSPECVEIFSAQGVTRTSAGGGVGGEDITVHLVPWAELRRWLAARRATGQLVDFRVFAALWLREG
jgi:ADP-ribose pyrophosphatase